MIQIWSVRQIKADVIESAEFAEGQLGHLKNHSVSVEPQIIPLRSVCRLERKERNSLNHAPFLSVDVVVENPSPSVRRQHHLIAVR